MIWCNQRDYAKTDRSENQLESVVLGEQNLPRRKEKTTEKVRNRRLRPGGLLRLLPTSTFTSGVVFFRSRASPLVQSSSLRSSMTMSEAQTLNSKHLVNSPSPSPHSQTEPVVPVLHSPSEVTAFICLSVSMKVSTGKVHSNLYTGSS